MGWKLSPTLQLLFVGLKFWALGRRKRVWSS